MAAETKKEQERDELHRAIWAIADELRGSVDGWDFKNYVLGTMFYRYISENLTSYINDGEHAAGNADFDYAKNTVFSDDALSSFDREIKGALIVTDTNKNQYIWYSDDKNMLPINTFKEKELAKFIGLNKGLVSEQLDF